MTKSSIGKTSEITYDGAMPFYHNSPAMSLSSAAANQNPMVSPCDGTIIGAFANLIQAGAGGTSHKLKIGTRASASAFGVHTFGTGDSTGLVDILGSLTVSTSVSKGDVIEFSTDGGATSAGTVAATLVIAPNNG